MRVVWSIRSFLDYRIPVFRALNELCNDELHVLFPNTRTPERVRDKIKDALGTNAFEFTGEKSLGAAVPSNQLANRGWLFTYQPGLGKKISQLNPDATIGDGFGQWSVPLIKRRIFKKTPFVMCYERTEHTERNAQLARRIYRKSICKWVDAACVNGRLSKDYLSSLGVNADRITTGFMASDDKLSQGIQDITSDDRVAIKQKYDAHGTTFVFVGRLIDRKGVLPMIEAWKTSLGKEKDATLLVAGEGDRKEEMEAFNREHAIENVKLLGAVPYDDIQRLYASADMLLMPTMEDNWSLVVPEAMSCGLPVLNSVYNGCWPELTIDGQTGWVFDPMDAEDFSAKLSHAFRNRDSLRGMSPECQKLVAQFTPQSAAQAIYDAVKIATQK